MLAVNSGDTEIVKRYISAIFNEFPELKGAQKYASLVGININREIDSALNDVQKVQAIKFLVLAMAKEFNGI